MITGIMFFGLTPYNHHYSTDVLVYWWTVVGKPFFLGQSWNNPGK